MRFAILGAGGVGSYYGARLLQAGEDVVFVARGPHLAAIREQGLTVRHPQFAYQGKVRAFDLNGFLRARAPSDVDVAILCTKANATPELAVAMQGWLSADDAQFCCISLQNGIDNESLLAERLGEGRIVGGLAVRIGAHILRPGWVEAVGAAQVMLGEWPKGNGRRSSPASRMVPALLAAFNNAGIPTQYTQDIRRELWRKLVINNAVNPLSALTGLDTRALTSHSEFSLVVYCLMQEAARAARADGVRLGKRDIDEMFALIRDFDPIKTSMLVDREKRRPLELEAICGAVRVRSRHLGVAAPYTDMVYALLKHSAPI